MIVRLLVLLLVTLSSTRIEARAFKSIPRPIIDTENISISPGLEFTIEGQGFIENYPQAHIVKLTQGKRNYKAKVISSTVNSLTIKAPEDLSYGNYNIAIKIKTRLLRSKATKKDNLILLRPEAPPALSFSYNVINKASELDTAISSKSFQGYTLTPHILNDETKLGPNQITASYTINGWQSLESISTSFYYFPEEEMRSALMLESESPLKTLALTRDKEFSFDVSSITEQETEDLSKHFYLSTPSYPKYLEYIISLSPVYIEKLHVKAEEYAVLKNRSSEDFLLENCTLSDSLKTRYEFESKDTIPAKQSIKLEANLGLNDSSPDSLSIDCNEEEIDKFSYQGLDAEGFGIRE